MRRQEIGEPKVETVDEDESEYEYESDSESVKEESKRKIAAATRHERELLAQPLFNGGHFIDEYAMEWLHHGSIDANVPTPRDPRVVSSLKTMLGERFTSDALDVDSYAESMLNELGVTERERLDPFEKLGGFLGIIGEPMVERIAHRLLNDLRRFGGNEAALGLLQVGAGRGAVLAALDLDHGRLQHPLGLDGGREGRRRHRSGNQRDRLHPVDLPQERV